MDTNERIEKVKVYLETSGRYLASPFKAEYKRSEKAGSTTEMIVMSFALEFGMQFSCFVDKTIFYKDLPQVKEEIDYMLKYVAPELVGKKYNAANFESYANALCSDINASIRRSWDEKSRRYCYLKIRVMKDDKYPKIDDYIPKNGTHRNQWICDLNDTRAIWFSKWELENCKMPFRAANESSFQSARFTGEPETVAAFSDAKAENFDDLPF